MVKCVAALVMLRRVKGVFVVKISRLLMAHVGSLIHGDLYFPVMGGMVCVMGFLGPSSSGCGSSWPLDGNGGHKEHGEGNHSETHLGRSFLQSVLQIQRL